MLLCHPKKLPKEANPPELVVMGASAACPGPGAGTRADPACPVPACFPCGAPAPGAGVSAALALAGCPLTPALLLRRWPAPASGACAAATEMVRCSVESGLTSLSGLGALRLGAGASALRRNAALAPPRPGAGAKAGASAFVLLPATDVGASAAAATVLLQDAL